MDELNFKQVNLEDKPIIDKFFSAFQPGISEYTFTNLFMWSKPKEIAYAIHNEGLIIKAHSHGKKYFLPPIGFTDCHQTFDFLINYGITHNIRLIELIPEHLKKYIKNNQYKIIPDRNSFDYLYRTQSLATLKGWRLDGKRGFVKKFIKNYAFEYQKYKLQHKKGCVKLMQDWFDTKIEKDPTVNDEWAAFHKFINNFNKLNAVGGVIIVDDKIIAFSFGEKLNDTTFVIHFEKADPAYIGSYQIINQLFVQNEVSGKYIFVNREQDMGIEGIRKAKLSYAPIRLVNKFTISF